MYNNKKKVLALKYRPKTFSDLIGQDIMAETIINSIKMDKVPNAYLFSGIRGVGKTTAARIVAKALNCDNGVENLCQNEMCEHCNAISNSNHLDVLEIDAASKTGIDDVRDLIEFSKYGPSTAKFKIFIIDEVHMLSKQAFNGLLKTLEEPPSYLKFIFATTEMRKIPITVVSRCQRFDLTRIKSDLLLDFLKKVSLLEKGKISENALKFFVHLSEGSVRDGLSLLDRALITQKIEQKELSLDTAQKIFGSFNKSHLIELMKLIFQGKEEQAILKFRDISDLGIDPKIFLNDFLEILYFMKNIKVFGKSEIFFSLSDNQMKEIEQLSNQVDVETLIMFWQFTIKSLEELNIVSNQNLSIEMFLIRLIHLKKIPKLEELLKNMETSQDKASSNEIETLSNIKNEIREDIIRDTNLSTDQIKNIIQEKKEILDNDKISKLLNKKQNLIEVVSGFDSLISLCLKHKEMQLKYDLEKNVSLVKFSNGLIEFSFNENFDKNFIKNLSKKLFDWTGKMWIITLSKKKGQPTYQENKLIKKQTQLNEVIKTNAYKKMLEAFHDAKLIDVEENKKKND
jgi:DNA polymerase-3 subunit gamma/tau